MITPRLRRLTERPAPPPEPAPCDLCAEPLPERHRHLLDIRSGELNCACRACAILFDRDAAGGDGYRLVPDRARRLPDAAMGDETWAALGVPVGLAFLYYDSRAGRIAGRYPSAAGLAEADPAPGVEDTCPVLRELTPDVEALLINRARGARELWRAPIDDCYALAGLVRTRWTGLTGGRDVWEAVEEFFADLERRR